MWLQEVIKNSVY